MSTLYERWILERSEAPHHAGRLQAPTHSARCDNPLCGDRVTVDVRVQDGRLVDIAFHARSCAVATAATSRMTTLVLDQTVADALSLAERARDAVDPKAAPPGPPVDHLAVVRSVRSRRRCATLGWEALQQALSAETP